MALRSVTSALIDMLTQLPSRPQWTACAALLLALGLLAAPGHAAEIVSQFEGRTLTVEVPDAWSANRPHALVLVMHGGLGSAERILSSGNESALNLNAVAARDGFMVAYLNGVKAGRMLSERLHAWNSGGGCCGLPAAQHSDDVGYVEHVVASLIQRYQIDPKKVYAIGHSNGAMMSQRMICESDVVAAAVAISGPLDTDQHNCPHGSGKRVLAIHGSDDENVPLQGGTGSKGISGVSFPSEQQAKEILSAAGGNYQLLLLPGVDHRLSNIESAIEASQHVSLGEKAAQFFALEGAAARP